MAINKKITFGKCLRIMRSDHLKTHMKQHEKEKFERESLCSSSIATSRTSLQKETESDFSSMLLNFAATNLPSLTCSIT